MTWPRLTRPPIVEALIEVIVDPAGVSIDALGALHDRVAGEYPTKRQRVTERVGFKHAQNAEQFVREREIHGYVFSAADERRVFQARRDGFSLNWLGDYESWSALETEARRLYTLYVEAARPESIAYIGVRYINRIAIREGADLDDWMRLKVVVPEQLPQSVGGCHLRLLVGFGEYVAAHITSVLEPEDDGFTWILDIDARDLEKTPDPRPEAVWNKLTRLRDVKNDVFFRSVTDKALEAYR